MELTKIMDHMEDIPWFNPQESANNNSWKQLPFDKQHFPCENHAPIKLQST